MKVDYRLPESVVMVQGTIDRIKDSKAKSDQRDYGEATADVLLTVRGDEGAGQKTLSLEGSRGDDDFTVELTSDQRLTAVSFKSVGVGSRVIGAGATLIATIAGVVVRARATKPAGQMFWEPREELVPKIDEEAARKEWEDGHQKEVEHQNAYAQVFQDSRAGLLAARKKIVKTTNPVEVAEAVSRAYRLETVAAAAKKEVDQVDELYRLWRERFKLRRTEKLAFTIPVDALPEHDGEAELPDVSSLTGITKDLWEQLGVLVEIGPPDGRAMYRRAPSPNSGDAADDDQVQWRVPRPVRLWVWRRAKDDLPSLERSLETAIVDRHSATQEMPLSRSVFGEQGGALVFDTMGAVTKIVRNDKSALGAFADALGAVPAAVVSGLDSASKISTSLASLTDADAERRLAMLKRQVEERTKDLELKGLNATGEDFAELKRLEQEVLLQKAVASLAPGSGRELAQLQAELALETARKDLDAAVRQRALDGELASAQAEIARLTAQLKLAKLRKSEDAADDVQQGA